MQEFQLLQLQFSQAVRQSEQLDFAGIAPDRLAVYQQLLFNNVLNFVSSAFPVLCSLHDAADWQQLVRQFFRQSVASSPYFLDIAGQFFEWLQLQPSLSARLPFLLELAHYEWIELYLYSAHRQQTLPLAEPDIVAQSLQLDELAMVLSYQFPVHQISPSYQPSEATGNMTLLLVYRDEGDEIRFVALEAFAAAMLHLLATEPGQSLTELVATLHRLAPAQSAADLMSAALPLTQDLARKGVIRAFQPT